MITITLTNHKKEDGKKNLLHCGIWFLHFHWTCLSIPPSFPWPVDRLLLSSLSHVAHGRVP